MSDFLIAILFGILYTIVLHREFSIWDRRRQATKRIKDYIEREHEKHPEEHHTATKSVPVKKVRHHAKTV